MTDRYYTPGSTRSILGEERPVKVSHFYNSIGIRLLKISLVRKLTTGMSDHLTIYIRLDRFMPDGSDQLTM